MVSYHTHPAQQRDEKSAARLGLQALVIGANNPPGGKPMGGAALYDALYATGYHANLNTTRALQSKTSRVRWACALCSTSGARTATQ